MIDETRKSFYPVFFLIVLATIINHTDARLLLVLFSGIILLPSAFCQKKRTHTHRKRTGKRIQMATHKVTYRSKQREYRISINGTNIRQRVTRHSSSFIAYILVTLIIRALGKNTKVTLCYNESNMLYSIVLLHSFCSLDHHQLKNILFIKKKKQKQYSFGNKRNNNHRYTHEYTHTDSLI